MNREKVLETAREYFRAQAAEPSFSPGGTFIPASGGRLAEDDLLALIDASLDLWLTHGPRTRSFEAELASWLGRKGSALFVNSGSSANLVAVAALTAPMMEKVGKARLKPGDEVITAAAAFPTTVNPIVQTGLRPVFVDVELATAEVTLARLQAAYVRGKTRAVVLSHTLGNPFRADKVAAWCAAEGLYLIEDCCDALGATVAGAPAGSFGDFATLSFFPAHHVTTGEGGALAARDGRLRKVAASLRDWGRDCWCEPGQDNTCGQRFTQQHGDLPAGYDHKYTYSNLGYNLKATEIQAALGLAQLRRAQGFIEARRRNWRMLSEGVRSSPALRERLMPLEPVAGTEPSWFGFAMHAAPGIERARLVAKLEERKVGTRLLFSGNLVKQPAYRGVDYRVAGSLANTEEILKRTFWIGVHPEIDQARIEYMLETLERSVKEL